MSEPFAQNSTNNEDEALLQAVDSLLSGASLPEAESDPRVETAVRLTAGTPVARSGYQQGLLSRLLEQHPATASASPQETRFGYVAGEEVANGPQPGKRTESRMPSAYAPKQPLGRTKVSNGNRGDRMYHGAETTYSRMRNRFFSLAMGTVGVALVLVLFFGLSTLLETRPNRAELSVPNPTPEACASWQIVEGPTMGGFSSLKAVAATSPNDVWAVGFSSDKRVDGGLTDAFHSPVPVRTLVEHWDGKSWNTMPSPNPSERSYLLGVAAMDESHAWAVGYYTTTSDLQETLVLAWDGTSWQQVPSPDVPGLHNRLTAVAALAPDDVWAVGSFSEIADFNGDGAATLLLHFDGKDWSIIPGANPGAYTNHLTAVSAASHDDIWAVGFQRVEPMRQRPLAIHWDGNEWTAVPIGTNLTSAFSVLNGVAAVPGAVWLIGGRGDIGGGSWQAQHLDMTGQVSNSSPDLRGGDVTDVYLSGITAGTEDNVWAVGAIATDKEHIYVPPHIPPHQTLVLHWNGSKWDQVASPVIQGKDNELSAIASVPGASTLDLWAVGESKSEADGQPLRLRYSACPAAGASSHR